MRSPETSFTAGASSRIWASSSSSGSKPSCETKRRARTSRSGSSRKLWGETVRRRRASRSARPPSGSTSSPVSSRRAIALTVKSRRRMSSSTESDASATISKSCRPGPVRDLLARRRELDPGRRQLRGSRRSRGWKRTPTSRSATTRSSTRPCGASAARSPSVSTPGHEEVGVLRVEPEQLVAHRAADEVGVEAERRDVVLDLLAHPAILARLESRPWVS